MRTHIFESQPVLLFLLLFFFSFYFHFSLDSDHRRDEAVWDVARIFIRLSSFLNTQIVKWKKHNLPLNFHLPIFLRPSLKNKGLFGIDNLCGGHLTLGNDCTGCTECTVKAHKTFILFSISFKSFIVPLRGVQRALQPLMIGGAGGPGPALGPTI